MGARRRARVVADRDRDQQKGNEKRKGDDKRKEHTTPNPEHDGHTPAPRDPHDERMPKR
jgi:hypothetical protein